MKICIIGYGSIGKRHGRILREYFGIEPLIVRRGDEIPDADIAMICTPTDTHVPIAIECAKRDMALFTEKPLSNSLDGLDELETIVDKKKLPTYVAYPFRHHEEVVRRYRLHSCHFRCLTNSSKWPSKRQLDHVLLELSHELDIVASMGGTSALRGRTVGGHSFWGHMRMARFTLSLNSNHEIREWYDAGEWIPLGVDDDLYARQFEWFFANIEYDMMNNIRKARPLLEKILEFIDG